MIEAGAGYFEDERNEIGINLKPEYIRLLIFISIFLSGVFLYTRAGFYFISLYDTYTTVIPVLLGGFLECVVFTYKFNFLKLERKVNELTGETTPALFYPCLKLIDPPILFYLFLASVFDLVDFLGNK